VPRFLDHAELLVMAADLDTATAGRTAWLGIDGFGAAGKTTLAGAIAAASARASVVHVDDFTGPGVREWDWERFDAQLAAPLRRGDVARYEVWAWQHEAWAGWISVAPGRLVVVEGVSSTRHEVDVPWDLTVWVDAPREVRLARAVDRDGPELLPRWLDDWIPLEEAYAAREHPRQRVDVIVSGAGPSAG
jgi:uridine kinase